MVSGASQVMPHGPHPGPGKVSVKCGSRNHLASLPALKPRVPKDALVIERAKEKLLCRGNSSSISHLDNRKIFSKETGKVCIEIDSGPFQLSIRVLSVLAGGARDKFQPTIRTRDGWSRRREKR